jgi:hypothetical protein
MNNSFPLLNGSFALTLRAADGSVGSVLGTYTGQADAPASGNTTAKLDLQITNASGIGAGVSRLQSDGGTGAFVGEGDFTLSLEFAFASTKSTDDIHMKLKGTAQISCSESNRILVTLHGTDSTSKFVEITIDLHHEVGFTTCFN